MARSQHRDLDAVKSKAEICSVLVERCKQPPDAGAITCRSNYELLDVGKPADSNGKEEIIWKRCFKCLICGHIVRIYIIDRSVRC